MGHLRQRYREKLGRKCEQDEIHREGRAEQTHTLETGKFLLLHSAQIMSEWTFEREIVEKREPNCSQRCTTNGQEPVDTSCSK